MRTRATRAHCERPRWRSSNGRQGTRTRSHTRTPAGVYAGTTSARTHTKATAEAAGRGDSAARARASAQDHAGATAAAETATQRRAHTYIIGLADAHPGGGDGTVAAGPPTSDRHMQVR